MRAVIFDMDGVVIDSEPLWKRAEFEIFSYMGVKITDELSAITKMMTTSEVTKFWYNKYPWQNKSLEEVEQMVISRVIELIDEAGDNGIKGLNCFLENLKSNNFKIGLATNSPYQIIPAVLKKAGVTQYFDVISSAEFEERGKPDPAVYLTTAKKLNIVPENCIVIEDSYSGMQAAKNAGMTVVAFINGNTDLNLNLADYNMESFGNFDSNIFQ